MKKVVKKTVKKTAVKKTRVTRAHKHGHLHGVEHEFIIIMGGTFVVVAVMFMLFV